MGVNESLRKKIFVYHKLPSNLIKILYLCCTRALVNKGQPFSISLCCVKLKFYGVLLLCFNNLRSFNIALNIVVKNAATLDISFDVFFYSIAGSERLRRPEHILKHQFSGKKFSLTTPNIATDRDTL